MFHWILNTGQTTFKMLEENLKTKESKDCQYLLFNIDALVGRVSVGRISLDTPWKAWLVS